MPTRTGIHNENEFYNHQYLAEIFAGDIQAILERWRKDAEAANGRTPQAELRALAPEHQRFRREFAHERSTGQRILRQREWFRRLLPALGYACKPAHHLLEDGSEVPILCAAGGNANAPRLLVLGACDPGGEGEDPLTLKPHRLQFHGEAPPVEVLLAETWERHCHAAHLRPEPAVALDRRPLPDSAVLLERGKWAHNRALRFDLEKNLACREEEDLLGGDGAAPQAPQPAEPRLLHVPAGQPAVPRRGHAAAEPSEATQPCVAAGAAADFPEPPAPGDSEPA